MNYTLVLTLHRVYQTNSVVGHRDSTFPIDAMDMNAGEAIAQSIPSSQSVDKTNTTTSSTLSPSNGSISGTMGMNSYALDSFEPSLFNINPLGINEPPQPPLANDLDFWLTADFDDDDGFNKDIGLAGKMIYGYCLECCILFSQEQCA